MAKKVKKSTKKAAKPAKKKPAPKKAVKKKPAAKKPAAKKVSPKKAVKKKPAAKKPVAKKTAAKKVVAKKPVAKSKPAKKVVAKKALKKVAPKKQEVKALVKKVAAPAPKVIAPAKNQKLAPAPKAVKKDNSSLDDENVKEKKSKYKSNEEFFKEFSYKPNIRKPLGDQPKPHIGKDVRTRYSDSELAEFKKLISDKLEEAQRDYELLKATLSHKDDHGTDDTSPTFKLLEDGSDVLSKEETAQLAQRQEKYIQNLKNALIRIENKTYGICRATGRLISKERLRSVPHATLDIDAKLEQNN